MKSLVTKSFDDMTLAERVRWMIEQRFSNSEIEHMTGAPSVEIERYRDDLAESAHQERFQSRTDKRVLPLQEGFTC
jgi:hypothetical protein